MVVEGISELEQCIAARTSYAFWAWEHLQVSSPDADATFPVETEFVEIRIQMAMREARRHYVGQSGDYESALARFKSTLEWREVSSEIVTCVPSVVPCRLLIYPVNLHLFHLRPPKETKIDLLKICFSDPLGHPETQAAAPQTTRRIQLDGNDARQCTHFEAIIENDLGIQKMAVRGHDKERRPIIVKFCREAKWSVESPHADEGFTMAQLYFAERAIAVAELSSLGTNEKLTAIFDYSAYDSSHAPPITVMVETLKALQANYPERLGRALILDTPYWMQAVMQLVSPFLSAATRDKLTMLGSSILPRLWSSGPSADEIRLSTVCAIVDPDQAMPFMLPNARRTSDIDVTHQLRRVPFYELYDSIPVVMEA
jgi:CRAL/TRIO domain